VPPSTASRSAVCMLASVVPSGRRVPVVAALSLRAAVRRESEIATLAVPI